ncbi:MAG: right-handed parallel beta-helix repeat-containing protein [Saprospiraceae bacterium]|nr:right-handed parallel beta-helix repeat-containing protein [Saprospiraceae bacterium]
MILKNHLIISKRIISTKILKIGGILALVILLVVSFFSILNKFSNTGHTISDSNFTLLGDAEVIEDGKFLYDDKIINGAKQQSRDFAFSGKHSIKLNAPNNIYGFSSIVKNVLPGDQIIARVWTYSPNELLGCIVINSLDNNKQIYEQSTNFISEKNGWKLLQTIVKITSPIQDSSLKIYCYNNNKEPIYFDDIAFYKTNKPLSTWEPEKIRIFIKEGEFAKLKNKRNEALKKGILMTTDDSWAKAAIYPEKEGDDKIKISLRLKGDWLDHLRGDKWSFRVKTETNKAWKRLKTFSLQDPLTRSYLKEWLLHKFFKKEDILTTRYDFITMSLNNKTLGLYVYEEHFLKQIPEFNKKREGPIIKFTENGLWEARLQAHKLGLSMHHGDNNANPDIRPFSERKTLNDANLSKQFKIAQKLLYQYQFGLKKPKEIFNLDLLAKYYAIMDVTGAHHGVIWHNQRFYYNPVIGKLEPIGFDGYDEYGNTWVKHPFIGYNASIEKKEGKIWHEKLFMDHDFLRKYMFYLNKFSNKKYISNFINSYQKQTFDRLFYIQSINPSYNFSSDYLVNRSLKIQEAIQPNSSSIHSRTVKPGVVAVYNKHTIPVEIIGTSNSNNGIVTKLDTPTLIFTTANYQLPNYKNQIAIPESAKFLVYSVPGLTKQYYAPINPWPVPNAYTPMQELKGNLVEGHSAYYYNQKQKKIIFKDSAFITKPIIIPNDHDVLIEGGTYMDITKKAFIISYSSVHFMGLEDEPILVTSSDSSANGITVLQCSKKSMINFTTFANMNTLAYKGWNLTGAVTFYESDVEIHRSAFTMNHCEDALNIIRSDFLVENSTVSHTYGDGFDADFCTGKVVGSNFYNTGNDGIDFSTSAISIINTEIRQAGDKGISIGEEGRSVIINTLIDGAVIGIASKDFSVVTVKSTNLKNCINGFSAYQKKPEYGGGRIIVEKYNAENLNVLYKIFPGSTLKLIEKEITGS